MIAKNQMVARWERVSGTSPGWRKDSVGASALCQPIFWLQRPYTANMIPVPPSSAMSDSADQTTNCAVGPLSTRGSAGQLLV